MLRLRVIILVASIISTVFLRIALAQESSTSSPWPAGEESPSPSVLPDYSTAPSPTPEQTPSPSTARSVRIAFVPPPMDGTISLGIYDKSGKLVRVLQQNAQLNDFAIGADALVTRWDGKDGAGQDLPPGKYRAHGYLIGPLKLENLGQTSPLTMDTEKNSVVKVRLVPNPLRKNKSLVVEVGVGFGTGGSYLETADGLPLFKISEIPNVAHAFIAKKSENGIDVWQDDGGEPHQFRILNVDQMMAFDCGEFELK